MTIFLGLRVESDIWVGMNLPTITNHFTTAVEVMEQRWTLLRIDKFNPRKLFQYVRSLRRCQRLREEIQQLMDTGKL